MMMMMMTFPPSPVFFLHFILGHPSTNPNLEIMKCVLNLIRPTTKPSRTLLLNHVYA